MSEPGKLYKFRVFPIAESDGAPIVEIHLQVGEAHRKTFEKDASAWIDTFCLGKSDRYLLIEESLGQRPLRCTEAEDVILALLCCLGPEADAAIVKLRCKGAVYTDISDIKFLEDSKHPDDYMVETHPVRLRAYRDGRPVTLYFFGAYTEVRKLGDPGYEDLLDAGYTPDTVDGRLFLHHGYPLSNGIVEANENRIYAGYRELLYDYYSPLFALTGEDLGNEYKCASQPVQIFLETSGSDFTFRILLHGRLYKKISKEGEKAVFHYTPFDGGKPDDWNYVSEDHYKPGEVLWPEENSGDIVFRKMDGVYRHTGQGTGSVLNPLPFPELPADLPADFDASKLYDACINALRESARQLKEFTAMLEGRSYTFSAEGGDGLFRAKVDGFTLTGTYTPAPNNVKEMGPSLYYSHFRERFTMESASFTERDVEVTLAPAEGEAHNGKLKLHAKNRQGQELRHSFDELRTRGLFSQKDFPDTVCFYCEPFEFLENLAIYQKIRDKIAGASIDLYSYMANLLRMDPIVRAGEMEALLYGRGMIPDQNVVAFAAEMRNEYVRTGHIPNIAIIGEAGTGKSEIAKRFAAGVFGKGVMSLSPSDLKAPYIGQTQGVVTQKLAEAAMTQKVFFIDEAYELMSDKFGREAVSLLLPLMTGDRTKVEARIETDIGEKAVLTVDFEAGKITIGCITETFPAGVPPIWIAGYETDIRLMISQNQGLFRRFRRIALKSPTADELYTELIETPLEKVFRRLELNDLTVGEPTEDAKKRIVQENAQRMRIASEKLSILQEQFKANAPIIRKFFRWGAQPQNSKYFASHAGVTNFLARCLDSLDFSEQTEKLSQQIERVITTIKEDIRHQCDVVRRKGDSQNFRYQEPDDGDQVQMIYDNKTRFKDLVGCESQIQYMRTIIDMFVHKSRYERNRVTVPKGVLLLGSPGVGKTFIARAMAGELQDAFEQNDRSKRVGFMSLSAPELTGKPVRFISSVFDAAGEYDVCVIFIDEVDAIAKNRFQNPYYNHFIELIKQMDGIEERSNVFILAATNAAESLDPAFVRSGRIDKKLAFSLPGAADRAKLVSRAIRARWRVLDSVDIEDRKLQEGIGRIAERTAALTRNSTPGDINNIVNLAFILYDQEKRSRTSAPAVPRGSGPAEYGHTELDHLYRHIYEAVERVFVGDPRSRGGKEGNRSFSVEKNNQSCSSVSIHEVGHALLHILCGGRPFEKITSLPRGEDILGYVMPSQEALYTKADYENRIRCCMGGRIAEELVYGKENISTGACGDMRQATALARCMVEQLGFTDDFFFMSLTATTARHLGTDEYTCSDAFRQRSDEAIVSLLQRLYQEARTLLADKRELIIELAEEVFKKETMTGEAFIALYQKKRTET